MIRVKSRHAKINIDIWEWVAGDMKSSLVYSRPIVYIRMHVCNIRRDDVGLSLYGIPVWHPTEYDTFVRSSRVELLFNASVARLKSKRQNILSRLISIYRTCISPLAVLYITVVTNNRFPFVRTQRSHWCAYGDVLTCSIKSTANNVGYT